MFAFLFKWLICVKKGHDYVNRKIVIRRKTNSCGAICEDYYAEILVCRYCGHKGDVINEKYKTYYTSVTMSEKLWDIMREKGYVIIS